METKIPEPLETALASSAGATPRATLQFLGFGVISGVVILYQGILPFPAVPPAGQSDAAVPDELPEPLTTVAGEFSPLPTRLLHYLDHVSLQTLIPKDFSSLPGPSNTSSLKSPHLSVRIFYLSPHKA